MGPTTSRRKSAPSQLALAAVAVLACLYFGREVLIPCALAVLITFLLSSPVNWLERLKLGRVLSVVIVLTIAYAAGAALIWAGAEQFSAILEKLPEYQANIDRKLEKIRNPVGSSKLSRAVSNLEAIKTDLTPGGRGQKSRTETNGKTQPESNAAKTPVPVEVVKPQQGIAASLGLASASAARVGAAILAVAVLTLFMLLRRGELRDRIFRLFGRGRINIVTTAMDDAGHRVSRYLFTQVLMNTTFGVLLGVGLYFIGVPYSLFWGVLGGVLRFIPYVGTLIAVACPFVMAVAVFAGWKQPLLTLALWACVELTIMGVLEPWLYAARAGISSLAVLLSAAFWTMLWGPVGLVIATPLTVCVVVLGRHVPQLEFLYILFGDEPALAPEASYYQRLLAMNEDEARDVLDSNLKEKSLLEVYDAVMIPALSLMEQDRHDGTLDEARQKFIYQTTREIIEDLGEEASAEKVNGGTSTPLSILCVPARDEADELAGLMLAQVLGQAGYAVQAIPAGFIKEMLATVTQEKPNILFISAVPPFALSHARSICRRAGQKAPDAKTVIGLWGSDADRNLLQQRLGPGCSDYVVRSLSAAIAQVRKLDPESGETDAVKAVEEVNTP